MFLSKGRDAQHTSNDHLLGLDFRQRVSQQCPLRPEHFGSVGPDNYQILGPKAQSLPSAVQYGLATFVR